ncbi:ELMO/CED-12 family protein [Dictyocaulus viviparus]|uniref:ELMO/CED-12 family protein n=1 Tax=Dictyocaulus viviparus TaxID=29172 RepID=A0A0D8Y1N4_DICVI|nr:ELMO/CED-12 family protein [Dictyocaulus viviparus]
MVKEEEQLKEEHEKAIEEWSEIELKLPDSAQVRQIETLTGLGNQQRISIGGQYFHHPDPLIEAILNEDYQQEMVTMEFVIKCDHFENAVASTMSRVPTSTLNSLVSKCLCRPSPRLESKSLNRERLLLLALSTVPYCNASTSQWLLLKAFYSTMSPLALDNHSQLFECSRKGDHWQIVGFQGCDPATDFRGTGILGLIQLYSMAKCLPETKLKEIVKLSRTEPNDFPLAVVGINITALLVTRLRCGDLLESAINYGGYLKAINKLHHACILTFCKQWKDENCTVKDCQHLLIRISDLLRHSRKHLNLDIRE